jgi:hypothetical protein
MVEEIDRLPEWAFTPNELDEMAIEILECENLSMSGHLVMYPMYKDGKDTGIVMLLAVESISDGLHAINRMWSEYDMYADIGEFIEEEDLTVVYRLKALELVLSKYTYKGKIRCAGSNRLYRYQKWFDKLL